MELWQRLLAVLRMRPLPGRRFFELDAPLEAALNERAGRERLSVEQVQADLLTAGLADMQAADELKQRWATLTPREQDVAALACLGYTNRQIAARLSLSPETVKSHVHMALVKLQVRCKEDLRLLFAGWDFSAWAPPPKG
jgi:DNA-binding NarL/FixJ family response regulator